MAVREPEPVPPPEPPTPPPVPAVPRLAASQILVSWRGAVNAPPAVTRSEAEAKAEAEALHQRLLAGEAFEALAAERSDGVEGRRGGSLGVFLTGTMVPEVEAAVAALSEGALSPPVRSDFGWHLLRRDAILRARVSHILVAWHGAVQSNATRTKEEARAEAQAIAGELAGGAAFAELAESRSDDVTGRGGGDLGWMSPGQFLPAFEDAAFKLAPGEVSAPVETPYGYHIILRSE